MCNLYTQTSSIEAVRALLKELQIPIHFPEGLPNLQAKDICITDRAPILRRSEVDGADLVMRRWSWPGPRGKPVYNYRSDGREFGSGRCLILADAFYEFTTPDDPKAKRKHKWKFTLNGSDQFAVAGLWRSEPEVGEAFTMLTTEPGEDVRPYHHRQVVVVEPRDFGRWLDPVVPARELTQPLPAGSLSVEQIC